MEFPEELLQKIDTIPKEPGCYLWIGKISRDQPKSVILYVGKAKQLRNRVKQYLSSDDYKTRFLMAKVLDIDWVVTNNEVEALLLENNLIKKHKPLYNIRLKDDKRYPYLCLTTGEPFPRLIITRKKSNPAHSYFGPYSDAGAARNTLALIHKLFPIRKRPLKLPLKLPARPCLNYHIGLCLSPCSEKVTRDEYANLINQIKNFLEGKSNEVQNSLSSQMNTYSQKMEFEKAAKTRDVLKDIQALYADQSVHNENPDENLDILGIYLTNSIDLATELGLNPGEMPGVSEGNNYCISQIVLLRIRNGNLISKGNYALTEILIENSDRKTEWIEEIIGAFFHDYYMLLPDIPSKIYISEHMADKEDWEKALKQKNGASTQIIEQVVTHFNNKIIKKDEHQKYSLINMAVNNARLSLNERILSERVRNQKFGLRQIQNFLSLSVPPEIIECYDISNIQGSEAVGCGVTLKNGIVHKSAYRRYQIKTKFTPDDPAMMKEVLTRRFKRLNESGLEKPNLIVIDGGITQLNAVLDIREKMNVTVPVISLAKREEEIYLDTGEILTMDKNSPGMLILRLARDEAHRFSVSYHRILRWKRNLKSIFDDIPGVGPKLRIKIMNVFSKIELNNFDRIDLQKILLQIKGVNQSMVEIILDKMEILLRKG